MLTLAFDTATGVATSALVDGDEVLGERASRAQTLLEDVDALLRQAGAHPAESAGSRSGSARELHRRSHRARRGARARALARRRGRRRLDARRARGRCPGAVPVIDAKRQRDLHACRRRAGGAAPGGLRVEPGAVCVGDGAVRYRALLEERGGTRPARRRRAPPARARASTRRSHGRRRRRRGDRAALPPSPGRRRA